MKEEEDLKARPGEQLPGVGGSRKRERKKTREGHGLGWWYWRNKCALLMLVVEMGGKRVLEFPGGVTCCELGL